MIDLVTAVITTHKRKPEVVERALKSVISQTYGNLEIIVVDDSPDDYPGRTAVASMVKGYGSVGVRYIPHKTCKGACEARNTGLTAATGTYIAFLDDDDEWLPQKIEKQIEKFVSSDIALVYCGSLTKNDMNGTIVTANTRFLSGSVYEELIKNNFIGSTSFPLLRTEAARSVGGFDPLMQSAQDMDLWLRLAKKYNIAYVEEALVVYHVHDGEQITKNYAKKVSGLERLNEKNADYLRADKEAFWIRTIKLAPIYAGNRQYRKAISAWLRAIIVRPWHVENNLRYLIYMFRNMI